MSKVCIGQIVNVHGLKGMVKIRPYLTNPMDVGRFGLLTDKDGHQSFDVKPQSHKGDFVLAFIKGISDRTAAEKLKGLYLYIDRNQLPDNKNGFYYCDLIGMTVLENGQKFGVVEHVQNYGAGDILEIKTEKSKIFSFDFSKATFPRVDIAAREIDIVVPKGMEVIHEN
ncbi:MAG: ribosome maturation factor RimM [Pseudomonadota bacterium]|nr:ribosome maturation factor RimM [Pseudomonadota bacterium]